MAQTTLIDRHVHFLNLLNEKTALSACEYFESFQRLQTFRTKNTFLKLPPYTVVTNFNPQKIRNGNNLYYFQDFRSHALKFKKFKIKIKVIKRF